MIRVGAIVLLVLWTTQQPQRDTPSVAPAHVATASVSGVVTLGDEALTPVRRAVVTMASSDGLESGSAVSDNEGRFSIARLKAGRYSLQALTPAHLTMHYGARRPGRPGTALVVNDGQSIKDLHIRLPRGAVLAGRVTLENGEPLQDTQVMAIPMRLSTAGGAAARAREFRTDDRGEFRIFGLLPDSYLIAALPSFSRGEIQHRTEQDFDAAVRALQQRGLAPTGPPAGARPESLERVRLLGYAPSYFPGTAAVADAQPITVKAGDVRDGLGFTVSPAPMATISGTLIGTDGGPARAVAMFVEHVGPPLPQASPLGPRVTRPNARGEFTIPAVAPGRYRIRARAGGVTLRPDGSTAEVNMSAQTEWAMADVTVMGSDVTGVVLALQPGRTFGAALVAEGAAPPASWIGTTVALQPVSTPGISSVATRLAPAGDEGRLRIAGLEPSEYEVRVNLTAALAGAGWRLASIRHQGRDLRDAPLTFADGSIDGAEIVLTTAVTELSGRLTLESGAPTTDYYIVAFPDDRTLWHAASPRVRVTRPAADGAFSTRDLPPGAYRLAALIDVEDDELRRADFLESIYDAAISLTVEAAKTVRQDIRIK